MFSFCPTLKRPEKGILGESSPAVLEGSKWNRRGCRLNERESTPSVTVCECNHLTHFAMMLSPGVEVCICLKHKYSAPDRFADCITVLLLLHGDTHNLGIT